MTGEGQHCKENPTGGAAREKPQGCNEALLLLLLSRFSVSDSVRLHRWQPTRLPRPWDFPGKSTGVGCHFLLQCMKVKGESEVAQPCLTLSDPMDCSLPGSSIHGIFQARLLEWGASAFSKRSPSAAKNKRDLRVEPLHCPLIPLPAGNHLFVLCESCFCLILFTSSFTF